MEEIIDLKHDVDSCIDVWNGLYIKIYPSFFGKYFDFSELKDNETSQNCKRWYIKLADNVDKKKDFPKFKMAGDCIFNFNDKKIKILKQHISSDYGLELLEYCSQKHHSFENFSFMPITGGMNNSKGKQYLDRPEKNVYEIFNYFKGQNTKIFSNSRGNKDALIWYLSWFIEDFEEKDFVELAIKNYMKEIYQITDEKFIFEEFISFANIEIVNEETAIKYMELAKKFWKKRNI